MDRRTLLRTGLAAGSLLLAGCSALDGSDATTAEPASPKEAARSGLRRESSWSAGVRSVERVDGGLEVQYEMATEGIRGNQHEAERRASRTAINVLDAVSRVGLDDASGVTVIAFVTADGNSPFPAHQVTASASTITSVEWAGVKPTELWDYVDEYDFQSAPF